MVIISFFGIEILLELWRFFTLIMNLSESRESNRNKQFSHISERNVWWKDIYREMNLKQSELTWIQQYLNTESFWNIVSVRMSQQCNLCNIYTTKSHFMFTFHLPMWILYIYILNVETLPCYRYLISHTHYSLCFLSLSLSLCHSLWPFEIIVYTSFTTIEC